MMALVFRCVYHLAGKVDWFCRLLHVIDSGKLYIDVPRFKDVAKTGETEELITREINSELQPIIE